MGRRRGRCSQRCCLVTPPRASLDLDFVLGLLHCVYKSDLVHTRHMGGVASAWNRVLERVANNVSTNLLDRYEECIETLDLDVHALVRFALEVCPVTTGGVERVDSSWDRLRLTVQRAAKSCSFEEIWLSEIAPLYNEHVVRFGEWLANHEPHRDLERWTGEPMVVAYHIAPSFLLPPPPDGRSAFFSIGSPSLLTVAFGIPRHGSYRQHGMSRGWLRRGTWHYLLKDLIGRFDTELRISDSAFAKHVMVRHNVNEVTATRLVENYLTRSWSTLVLESAEDRIRALTSMRGSGYGLTPYMIQHLQNARHQYNRFSDVLKSTLDSIVPDLERIHHGGTAFNGTLEAVRFEHWGRDTLALLPPSNALTARTRRRLLALCKLQSHDIHEFGTDFDERLLQRHAHWLVGTPDTNAFVQTALESAGVVVDSYGIEAFGHTVKGTDLTLTFLQPHPNDPTKWRGVATATSDSALGRLGRSPFRADADFAIASPANVEASGNFGSEYWNICPIHIEGWGQWPAPDTRPQSRLLEGYR
jgi:hypothetical protein